MGSKGDTTAPPELELEERFAAPPRQGEAAGELTLCFTGDNLLGSRMTALIAKHGEAWPYQLVAEPLRAADLAFGNLECPITDYAHSTPGKPLATVRAGKNFIFKAPPQVSSRILADTGYDIVSLANNHAMDYCAEGLLDTLAELDAAKLAHAGAGRDAGQAAQGVVLESGGWRVGYLAYTLIVPPSSRAGKDSAGVNTLAKQFQPALAAAIGELRQRADIVVVSLHWGQEGSRHPAAYQREIAHRTIEAGADIVAGHHPHCLQGVELCQGGVIAYSLGNFLFTGKSSRIESFILRVKIDGAAADAGEQRRCHISRVELLPVWVRGGRPEPSQDSALLRSISDVCASVGTRVVQDNGLLVVEADAAQ